ncbi:MAG: hypothetical protein BroJett041_02610 [Candidatus Jettenia caeni]|nr:MAG: hypothetical protein BroJett041_02610 [Candidatus Jettenia caeni]
MEVMFQPSYINLYVNIMDQYHPCYLSHKYAEINRCINDEEFENVLQIAWEEGIHRLDSQMSIYP